MPAKPNSGLHPQALAVLIFLAALLATWFSYAPGLAGSLHFDDQHNLGGLANVKDRTSAVRFITTGIAGPLGRPIALASFVPQAYAWPVAPDVFLRTNVLIHLLNGVLVIWFLYLLGRARQQTEQQSALIATGAGGLWMLMPLLASSSLFIVQRMTTLSAVFVLLGAVAYMYARQATGRRPVLALCCMTIALGAGGILGALTKENGALLFLFILATEAVLLNRPTSISRTLWRSWYFAVLVVPLALLSVVLVSALPYSEDIVLLRDFTGLERLLTQAGILWKYLYFGFVPNPGGLGPFHDDYATYRTLLGVLPALAVGSWLVVITAAVVFRREAPLFCFAVAWYLGGHILESTTLPLELYFEHRNYLPIVGPLYAFVASLVRLDRQWRRLAISALTAYAVVFASVTFSVTSLWGSPALAAEMWHIYKPNSLRAAQYLAGRLELQGDPSASRRVLRRYMQENPETYGVRLQILLVSCQIQPNTDYTEEVELLEERFASIHFNHSVVAALDQLYQLAKMERCPSVDASVVYTLGQRLLDNPRFNSAIIRHNLHVLLARIAMDQRDFGLTMSHIDEALRIYPNSHTLILAIGILNSGGRHDISWELLQEAREKGRPKHPLRALQWARDLDQVEAALLALEKSGQSDRPNQNMN